MAYAMDPHAGNRRVSVLQFVKLHPEWRAEGLRAVCEHCKGLVSPVGYHTTEGPEYFRHKSGETCNAAHAGGGSGEQRARLIAFLQKLRDEEQCYLLYARWHAIFEGVRKARGLLVDLEGVHAGSIEEPRLEMRNLSFRYAEGEPWVIENFSLTIEPGETVAIAAPSGAGKTTLAKLVLGLLEPNQGEIRFGGIDIRRLGLKYYRGLVAAVMQDDHLFAGSIADNISLFDPEATSQRIEAAAQLAQIHQEIVAMPMGYETLVGDMGSSLSGGQKQRVLLARALYRKPKFLVLDEATSHLDVAKEREINALVKRLKITRMVLAHRPETLASADRVIVLGKGNVQTIVVGPGSGRQ